MHTMLDLRGAIPAFIHISDGKMHEVEVLDFMPVEAGAFYVMDRGCVDFSWQHKLHQAGAFLVITSQTRDERKTRVLKPVRRNQRRGLRPEDCTQWFARIEALSHSSVPSLLQGPWLGQDADLSDQQHEPAAADHCRPLQASLAGEVVFKRIKQNLRSKRFLNTSEIAVKTQIWSTVSTYTLIAIEKELNLDASLYTLLQILSVSVFEKIPRLQAYF